MTYPNKTSWSLLQLVVLGCLSLVTVVSQAIAQEPSVQKSGDQKPAIGEQPALPIAQISGEFYPSTHWDVDRTRDFLEVGMFNRLDPNGRPEGWDDLSAFETDQAFARKRQVSLRLSDTSERASISTSVDLFPDAEFVTVEVKLRGPSIKLDEDPVADAGAGVVFSMLTSDGQRRELPRIDVAYQGYYRGWTTKLKTIRVLPNETKLNVRIELVDAKGAFDVSRIKAYASTGEGQPTAGQMQLLFSAIQSDNVQAIVKLVETNPNILEARSEHCDNGSPLARAAWHDSPKVAAKLIELGADIESKDYVWGNTPLQWSCYFGRAKAAKVLLEAGAATKRANGIAKSQRKSGFSASRTPKEFDTIIRMIAEQDQKRAEAGQE